jgi:hypothetical protein
MFNGRHGSKFSQNYVKELHCEWLCIFALRLDFKNILLGLANCIPSSVSIFAQPSAIIDLPAGSAAYLWRKLSSRFFASPKKAHRVMTTAIR